MVRVTFDQTIIYTLCLQDQLHELEESKVQIEAHFLIPYPNIKTLLLVFDLCGHVTNDSSYAVLIISTKIT